MSIFGDQTIRLLREKWRSPVQLAEELFAMFTSTGPVTIPAGSKVAKPADGQPYLTLIGYTPGESAFDYIKPNGDPGGPVPISALPDPLAEVVVPTDDDSTPSATSSFPGVVVSGGPGDTYDVEIFENGVTQASTRTVSVKQLQIHADATIPAGSSAVVHLGPDGAFFMQVPVWI